MIRVAVLLVALQLASCQKLPTDWKRCHRNNPNTNECILGGVADAIKKIGSNGIESLGVPSLDPLDIKELALHQRGRGNGPVSLKLTLHDLQLHGLTSSEIKKFDLERYVIDGESYTPALTLDAEYRMEGKILVLPVTGKGRCNITMVGVRVTHELQGKPVERNGKLFMDIQTYKVGLHPKKMHAHFHNLFNGDKTLGDTMNNVINQNWELIFNELKPSIEEGLSREMRDFSNYIFTKVPYDDIFLP